MVGAAVNCSMEHVLISSNCVHTRFQVQVVVDYPSDDGRVQEQVGAYLSKAPQVLVQIFIESESLVCLGQG